MLANFGLLLIRVVIGLSFIGHGGQKLFAWFGGGGPRGTAEWFAAMGIAPRKPIWAILAGAFELVGGILFGAGVLTAVGAALISIIMLDAIITVHAKNGYWVSNNGIEYPFVLIAVVVGVAMIGPGDYVLYSFS